MERNYVYLGKGLEEGVYKIGMTKQTCWSRCHNSDYRIGIAFSVVPKDSSFLTRNHTLHTLEQGLIKMFKELFPIAHGKEYFKINASWDTVKELFSLKITSMIEDMGLEYRIYDDWCAPYTY